MRRDGRRDDPAGVRSHSAWRPIPVGVRRSSGAPGTVPLFPDHQPDSAPSDPVRTGIPAGIHTEGAQTEGLATAREASNRIWRAARGKFSPLGPTIFGWKRPSLIANLSVQRRDGFWRVTP